MVIRDAELRLRINTAKEAADLHSNIFSQYILWDYLSNNDISNHISRIQTLYQKQCNTMLSSIGKTYNWQKEYFNINILYK